MLFGDQFQFVRRPGFFRHEVFAPKIQRQRTVRNRLHSLNVGKNRDDRLRFPEERADNAAVRRDFRKQRVDHLDDRLDAFIKKGESLQFGTDLSERGHGPYRRGFAALVERAEGEFAGSLRDRLEQSVGKTVDVLIEAVDLTVFFDRLNTDRRVGRVDLLIHFRTGLLGGAKLFGEVRILPNPVVNERVVAHHEVLFGVFVFLNEAVENGNDLGSLFDRYGVASEKANAVVLKKSYGPGLDRIEAIEKLRVEDVLLTELRDDGLRRKFSVGSNLDVGFAKNRRPAPLTEVENDDHQLVGLGVDPAVLLVGVLICHGVLQRKGGTPNARGQSVCPRVRLM